MTQREFDWTYLQREAWINEAEIPEGKAHDEKGVAPKVMAGILHEINKHLGRNSEAWPSQERMAERLRVSKRTIIRGIQALLRQSLLIVIENESPRGGYYNSYRIVWTELQLLEPVRRAAWLGILRGVDHGDLGSNHGDLGSNHGDLGSNHGDLGSNHGDLGSPEQLINNSQNNPSNNSPQQRTRDLRERRAADGPVHRDREPTWEVVVSALREGGVCDVEGAIRAAHGRQLSPRDVLGILDRWRLTAARDPGHLHRYITGRSRLPDAAAESGSSPPMLSQQERQKRDLEFRRTCLVKACKRQGMSQDEIRQQLRRALVEDGLPPDAIEF